MLYHGQLAIYPGTELRRSVTRPGVMKMIDDARWIYQNHQRITGIQKEQMEPWIALGRFVEAGEAVQPK